ncbi:SapC family protein [uncultured Thiohalocapsa sp.]|uniref:SapC family protein n=1 Tax=uncultured Thiohalocapsa sp. TaxID=768990 RepID=UPI0025DA5E69|nr:SapC family protein [uncultured Thiohalocapsa sp.]
MPNWQPVTQDRHGHRHWRRAADYHFAADRIVVPVAAAELSQVAVELPMAFLKTEQHYTLCVVLGFEPGHNLCVDVNGRWLVGYVPAALRAYPFGLGKTNEDQLTLCVDEDSGLLTEPPDGEAFFSAPDEPAQTTKEALDFLAHTEQSRAAVVTLSAQLHEAGLIAPWPLEVTTSIGKQPVDGLYRIDVGALDACPADTLKALQQRGALSAAYAQLLSMQRVQRLAALAQRQAQAAQQHQGGLDFLGSDGSITFDPLG